MKLVDVDKLFSKAPEIMPTDRGENDVLQFNDLLDENNYKSEREVK